MEEAGIVSAETKGHRVRVSLLGEHLEAALAQDQVVQVMTSDATSVAAMSPEMRNATRLLEAAEQVGAPIELRAVIAWTR